MHKDPTFDAVYKSECRRLKSEFGCLGCVHRGKHLAWEQYSCTKNNTKNKYGYCRDWAYRGDV